VTTASKNTQSKLTSIQEKLDQLIFLVACQVTQGQSVAQAAPVLKRLGLNNSQIATVLGSTPNAISVRLAEAKGKKAKSAAVAAPDGAGR
jgi:hypothetical protein